VLTVGYYLTLGLIRRINLLAGFQVASELVFRSSPITVLRLVPLPLP
jgi:hypothetical protein